MKVDPKGLSEGECRVDRGGSWFNVATNCRVANRYSRSATNASGALGFRICMPVKRPKDEG